jgi:hypothetical protein
MMPTGRQMSANTAEYADSKEVLFRHVRCPSIYCKDSGLIRQADQRGFGEFRGGESSQRSGNGPSAK